MSGQCWASALKLGKAGSSVFPPRGDRTVRWGAWRVSRAGRAGLAPTPEASVQKPTDPAHAFGGCLGVVTELLRHPAGAATDAEPPYGGVDRLRHDAGARRVRPLQPRSEQRLPTCVIH